VLFPLSQSSIRLYDSREEEEKKKTREMMLRRAAQRFEARRRRWKCAPRFGNTAVVHQSLFFSTEDTLDDDQRALDRRGQWREELLEEEISAEEHGENAENKPAHLEAKAARLREDAIAAEDAAETARKRIERHRRQRTRELENRAKELREEARDLDRRACALRNDDEEKFRGTYSRGGDGGFPRDGV
jgi:hypothetical protein